MAKSLKEQNNWKIWLVVAVNVLVFWTFANADAIRTLDLSTIATRAPALLPAGLASIVATVLNAFISADLKARIVFFRWRHALPGHRAFTHHINDPRVDASKIASLTGGQLPQDPGAQNSAWYKLFKSIEGRAPIADAHKTFLFLRDFGSLSVLFLIAFGAAGLVLFSSREAYYLYLAIAATQFLLVAFAARNAGVRLVTNVLAAKSAR